MKMKFLKLHLPLGLASCFKNITEEFMKPFQELPLPRQEIFPSKASNLFPK